MAHLYSLYLSQSLNLAFSQMAFGQQYREMERRARERLREEQNDGGEEGLVNEIESKSG